jgi:hypothetical protein
MVTPCFMLVYPEREEVELYYGYTLSDNVGRAASLLGLLGVGLAACIPRLARRRRAARRAGGPAAAVEER